MSGTRTVVPIEHVEVDERGVAYVRGTGLKVIHVVMSGQSYNRSTQAPPPPSGLLGLMTVRPASKGFQLSDVFDAFPQLKPAELYAVLAYYYDHKAEVDAQIEESRRNADAMRAAAGPQPTRDELLARLKR